MAATPSVVIKKTIPHRGGVQNWSNRYHFAGGTPANNTAWDTLFDAIVADEADCLYPTIEIVEAVGYTAGSTTSAHSKSYTTAGNFPGGSYQGAPAECVGLIRYSTAARSSKGHPVYLFSYMHGALFTGTFDADLYSGYKTALEEYADDWLAGFSDGTNTYTRAGPNGAAATARYVDAYATHRDFPR